MAKSIIKCTKRNRASLKLFLESIKVTADNIRTFVGNCQSNDEFYITIAKTSSMGVVRVKHIKIVESLVKNGFTMCDTIEEFKASIDRKDNKIESIVDNFFFI